MQRTILLNCAAVVDVLGKAKGQLALPLAAMAMAMARPRLPQTRHAFVATVTRTAERGAGRDTKAGNTRESGPSGRRGRDTKAGAEVLRETPHCAWQHNRDNKEYKRRNTVRRGHVSKHTSRLEKQ